MLITCIITMRLLIAKNWLGNSHSWVVACAHPRIIGQLGINPPGTVEMGWKLTNDRKNHVKPSASYSIQCDYIMLYHFMSYYIIRIMSYIIIQYHTSLSPHFRRWSFPFLLANSHLRLLHPPTRRRAAMGRIRHIRLDQGGVRPPLASPKGDLPQGAATYGPMAGGFNPSE